MLVGFAFPGGLVEQIVIGAVSSILAAIVIDVALRLRRHVSGWSRQRIRLVSFATGLAVALFAAVGIGYNWRASQGSGLDVSSPQPTVSDAVVSAATATPAAETPTPATPAPTDIAATATATQSAAPAVANTSEASPQSMMTEAPPTIVHINDALNHAVWVAALRAYVAHEPELLSDRNAVLGYVDQVFFASAKSECHNGQVSEFDEHRYYDSWVQRIKGEVAHWRDDVPLTFNTTLGTYDFQRRVLPLQLNPQGLVVTAYSGYRNCSFTVPAETPFYVTDYYQIAPGTVPQSLAVTPARGEQILNLVGGRNVTVALHGTIENLDPHYVLNGSTGYGISYQPTEVTLRSGMVPIYHALVHASK